MSFEAPSMVQSPAMEQSQLLEWRMNPLQQVAGIEVKEHMQEIVKGKRRSMSASYKDVRKDIMSLPPGVVVIAYLGRSNSGKSSDAQADYKLLHADEVLKAWQDEEGIPLVIDSYPFAYGMEALKTPRAHREFPQWAIPADIGHGMYSAEQYARQSGLQAHVIETHVLPRQDKPNAHVLLLESSCPTAIPVVESGRLVDIRGIDRGVRVIFDLALREETRERMHIFVFERNSTVAEEGVVFRESLNDEAVSDQEVFWGNNVFSYDDLGEGDPNEIEKPVKILPSASQRLVRHFVSRGVAPPEAQERSDRELDNLKEEISKEGIPIETDRDFFAYIQALLGMPNNRFHYITNQHFLGEKGFDLNYFIHSLPVRLFPEIVRR